MTWSRTTRLLVLNIAALALLAAVAPKTEGADPFVAGGRSTRPVSIERGQADGVKARAAALNRALGLGGVTHTVERLDDRFEHRTYDEVSSFDAGGRPVAVARFDADGRVLMAVGLGWRQGRGTPVTAAVAGSRGAAFAAAAGIKLAGRPSTVGSAGAGGWVVTWPRIVDGVPVSGDGVRVLMWRDGTFHGLAREERALAPVPSDQIDAATAQSVAEAAATTRFPAAAGDLRVVAVEQRWVAPNDTWDPARPDAPEAVLELAWVVRFEAHGSLADRVRLVEFWIDAGDGSLLGGDVAE
jgi:hypothetical protein